jgi:hypothetical protein
MSTGTERSASAGVRVSKATIREDILQSFPNRAPGATAVSRAGPRKICLAEVGRHL